MNCFVKSIAPSISVFMSSDPGKNIGRTYHMENIFDLLNSHDQEVTCDHPVDIWK